MRIDFFNNWKDGELTVTQVHSYEHGYEFFCFWVCRDHEDDPTLPTAYRKTTITSPVRDSVLHARIGFGWLMHLIANAADAYWRMAVWCKRRELIQHEEGSNIPWYWPLRLLRRQ